MSKALEAQVAEDLKMKTTQVIQQGYKDLKIDSDDLAAWITHFKDHPRIKKQADTLKKLNDDVFLRCKIDQINFHEELPDKLDPKMYIAIYRKIWAAIRHNLWKALEERKEELRCGPNENLPQNEFIKIQNEQHENFEQVRNDVWELMMDERVIPSEKRARKMMQKAYVTFATVPQYEGDFRPESDAPAERSRWADQVSVIAQQHTKYIKEFESGKYYAGIESDPRLSAEPDEKVSLKSTPAYERGQTGVRIERKNTLADEGRNVQQMDPGAQKLISNYAKNFKERFRQKKAQQKKEEVVTVEPEKEAKEAASEPASDPVQLQEQQQPASPEKV